MYLLKRFSCASFLAFIASSSCFAQAPLSLKEVIGGVTSHAPELLADSASVRIRQLQADATAYNWLPSLKLSYQADLGTNNNLPGGYFSYGIVPGNSRVRTTENTNTILTDLGIASFDWELYNFGAYGAQRKVASSDAAVEQARFGLSKYNLEAVATDYYFQLSRLQDLLGLQLRNINRNEEISRSIRALARNGIRAGVDTSIAEAELSRAQLNYIELQEALQQTKLQLSAVSGIDTARLTADTAYAMSLPGLMLRINALPSDSGNYFIRPFELAYQNSLDREALTRKSYSPKISLDAAAWSRGSSLTAADEFRSLPTGLGFDRSNYLVGLGITYNLFDLKHRQLQLRIQKAASDYSRKELEAQKASLALRINSADAGLRTALQRQAEIPRQLSAANAAYRQKLSLYRNGLTDILELDAALNVLYRAETDAIAAKYLYVQALFRKAVANGTLNDLLNAL